MKRPLGLLLIVLGGAMMTIGILGAVRELKSLYSDTIERPLDAPQDDGKEVSAAMLKQALLGLAGAPPFVIGLVLFKLGRPRKHPL